jgi:hypothetical protein
LKHHVGRVVVQRHGIRINATARGQARFWQLPTHKLKRALGQLISLPAIPGIRREEDHRLGWWKPKLTPASETIKRAKLSEINPARNDLAATIHSKSVGDGTRHEYDKIRLSRRKALETQGVTKKASGMPGAHLTACVEALRLMVCEDYWDGNSKQSPCQSDLNHCVRMVRVQDLVLMSCQNSSDPSHAKEVVQPCLSRIEEQDVDVNTDRT